MEYKMKLSEQAIKAIMLTLVKGVSEQIDVTQVIKDFELVETEEGLVITNPPTVEFPTEIGNV